MYRALDNTKHFLSSTKERRWASSGCILAAALGIAQNVVLESATRDLCCLGPDRCSPVPTRQLTGGINWV